MTLDLTDDEKLALVAHLRHALEYDPFPYAPRGSIRSSGLSLWDRARLLDHRRDELRVHVAGLKAEGLMVGEAKRPAAGQGELHYAAVAAGHPPDPFRAEDPLSEVASVSSLHPQREALDSGVVTPEQPIQSWIFWEMPGAGQPNQYRVIHQAALRPESTAPGSLENGGGKVCHGSGGIVPLLAE